MSRRDQLKDLSAQLRQAPQEPPVTKRAAGETGPDGGDSAQAQAPTRAPIPQAPQAGERPGRTGTAKTSLNLPARSARRLREWSQTTGRSLADGIVSTLLEHGDDLEQQARGDDRRRRLGLPALAGTDNDTERTTVTIRIPAAALDELDAAARRLGLSRSALAAALLEKL